MPTPSRKATGTAAQLNEKLTKLTPEEEDVKEDEMVNVLEELILEAYNNMQIDEEYIFLPHEVAEKLHRVAEQMTLQESAQVQIETKTNAGEDSGSGKNVVNESKVEEVEDLQQEIAIQMDRPEPEQENEYTQEKEKQKATEAVISDVQQHDTTGEDKETREHEMHTLQAKTTGTCEKQQKERIIRVASTEKIGSELAPVLEVEESAASEPPSPSPRHMRSHIKAYTPKSKKDTPASKRGQIPPPKLVSTRHSLAPRTPDQSGGNKRKSKLIASDKKANVTPKPKNDKLQREQLVRETARKQRENSKRQLEEIHQREMEEKRERVRRIKEERLHRRSGLSTEVKRAKKTG